MFSLNISCTVCKETFKNSDSIYTTQCGHVFHYFCINEWRSRTSICPYCKSYNAEPHRIYFNFNNEDESMDFDKTVNDLKSQLKDSVDKVFNLSTKLKKSEDQVKKLKESSRKNLQKIDDIQRLYNISEQWRAEFQDKLQGLTEENDKLREKIKSKIIVETTQVSMSEDETTNQTNEEVTELRADNLKLNKKINEIESSKMVLNYKIEMLEQRLKHLNLELKQQITENINRPINKLSQTEKFCDSCNQQKIIDEANLNQNLNSHNIKRSTNNLKEIKSDHNEDTLNDSNSCINRRRNSNNSGTVSTTQASLSATRRDRKFILANPNDCKVIIKEFPRKELSLQLKNVIIDLAKVMSINLVTDDILKVSIIDKNVFATNIALLVEFKRIDTKVEFLSNRNRLKSFYSIPIQIKEYIDETIYPIFMYANRNLRSNGYEYICCKNNQVFAKKCLNDATEIAIKSRDEVDRLIGRTVVRHSMVGRNARIRKNRIPIQKSISYENNSLFDYSDSHYEDSYDCFFD